MRRRYLLRAALVTVALLGGAHEPASAGVSPRRPDDDAGHELDDLDPALIRRALDDDAAAQCGSTHCTATSLNFSSTHDTLRARFSLKRPDAINAERRARRSASLMRTRGGRTTARLMRPSSANASFMRLCMSTNGGA